jgi:hypothetical protein
MIDKQQYFTFLDVLRESGVTNMFGAPMYLVDEFGLSRREAQTITKEWMEQFERKEPQRAGA